MWLRFTVLARLGRFFGFDTTDITMKVATDPEKRREVEKVLDGIAKKYNIPLRVMGTTLLRAARYEAAIERQGHARQKPENI